jgi:hypothetical protein
MSALVAGLGSRWEAATRADAGWLILCGLVFWASRWAGKLFEGVPGHQVAFWVPVLFLAVARVPRSGAAALTALGGSFLWTLPQPGLFGLAPFVASGVALDVCALPGDRLRRFGWAVAAGALCGAVKFSFHNLPAAILGTGHFLAWGAGSVALLHLLFGAVGGAVGWLVRRLAARG